MATKCFIFSSFLYQLIIFLATGPNGRNLANAAGGQWAVLKDNIGITAMHMQLLNNDRVIIFDRTDFGKSQILLPNGKCRVDPNEVVLKTDCTAHSVEYDVASNSIRPLMVQTDVWCSSGAVSTDGNLMQVGGFNDGDDKVRIFKPCGSCDWQEIGAALAQRRWYATSQRLPDGRQIIVGGRAQYNYEFYPKNAGSGAYSLPLLEQTNDRGQENNLYPFVLLNVDGNLFIFSNNRAVLLDYKGGKIVKTYPQMPDGNPRNYPSTGSAVLLPLKDLQGETIQTEVLICGGAPKGSFTGIKGGRFVEALKTCGRISLTSPAPRWVMETMPLARVMGDMLLLPDGNVLIINGASTGAAGWENGRNPALQPVIYHPDKAIGTRFEVQNAGTIPRMYHSSALLIRDGRVLVGGSNPHEGYMFKGVLFPTELRLEAFSPSYLDARYAYLRPKITSPAAQAKFGYGQQMTLQFTVPGALNANSVMVTMIAPSFNTHSFSMNQRLLVLGGGNAKTVRKGVYEVGAVMPGSGNLAPSGYYLLFVIHQDIPSTGVWVHIQ